MNVLLRNSKDGVEILSQRPTLQGMASVVIVEDEQRIRELMARVMADQGYHVETTSNAMDGLQAVVKSNPDLVILDMGLPDLDGSELLKMIRAVSQVQRHGAKIATSSARLTPGRTTTWSSRFRSNSSRLVCARCCAVSATTAAPARSWSVG